MAIFLRMPEVAANESPVTLAAWNKQVGEAVAVGDNLADIETDKAVIEYNAEAAGIMGKLLVSRGQEVKIGTLIAILLEPGEKDVDFDTLIASEAVSVEISPAETFGAEESLPSTSPSSELLASGQLESEHRHRIFASPLARRLATQLGVEIGQIKGSGPSGRVIKKDVEASCAQTADAAILPSISSSEPENMNWSEIPHSNMRRTIARRLTESKSTIPHFYLSMDCNMDRLLTLRSEINSGENRKISINDFVIRAVAMALREVPGVNTGWTDTAMRQYNQVDISVAVSTDSGLITPIVRNADQKMISVISAEVTDLATRARAGKLLPNEYQGGCFSVSNLGMYGVSEFSAIINPPQAAILAIGATKQIPVVEEGTLAVASMMRCTLSVDHRAIDGALAAKWLATFKHIIESPMAMLI